MQMAGWIFACAIAAAANAQVPSCNLVWEVNDGSGWRGGDVVTSQRALSVRLRADWSAPGEFSFFYVTDFDATISGTAASDSVGSFTREAPFTHFSAGFSGQLASYRFGNTIKIDSVSDSQAPGAGPGWIETYQSPDTFPHPDYSRSIPLFSYALNLADEQGIREISSVMFRRFGVEDLRLWVGSTPVDVQPVVVAARVTYVPTPPCAALGLLATLACRRRREALLRII